MTQASPIHTKFSLLHPLIKKSATCQQTVLCYLLCQQILVQCKEEVGLHDLNSIRDPALTDKGTDSGPYTLGHSNLQR